MDEDLELFNINLSSSDESPAPSKLPRDYQSEESFQRERSSWKPKIDKGEIWKGLRLPMSDPSKPESQAILHALEELYFNRRFGDTEMVAEKALEGKLQDDFRIVLEDYVKRCRIKLAEEYVGERAS